MAVSSAARSTTSGSRAQFSSRVSPSASTAAISRSSVPVTVMRSKTMCAPRSAQRVDARFKIAVLLQDDRAHFFQALDVQIDGTAADGAAAGHGHARHAGARHERTQDQRAGAHGFHDLVARHGIGERTAADGDVIERVVFIPSHLRHPWRRADAARFRCRAPGECSRA